MSIEPEGAPINRSANVPASASRDAKPARLTADTVPRFFNWGAFLIPVPWCLAMRQWGWAIAAAATPLVLVVKTAGHGGFDPFLFHESVVRGSVTAAALVICPLWLSLVAAIGFAITTHAYFTLEILRITLPLLVYWFIPFAVSLYLGFAGNRLAVTGRRFEDGLDFWLVQRRWVDSAIQAYVISIALLFLLHPGT